MRSTVELAVCASLQHTGRRLDARREHPIDRVDPDRFLRLLVGQPHIEEAVTVQGVQEEAVLGNSEQHRHRVGELGLHP